MKTSSKILLGGFITISLIAMATVIFIKANTVIKINGEVVNEYEDWDKDLDVFNYSDQRMTNFTGINSNVTANMFIRKGPHKVVMSIERKNKDKIYFEEKEGMLYIRQKKNTNLRDRALKIQITLPNLDALILNGSGYTQTDLEGFQKFDLDELFVSSNGSGGVNLDVDAKKLTIKSLGSGSLEVMGSGDSLNINLNGSGSIHSESFKAKHVDVFSNGSGYIEVLANESLKAMVNGSGSVRYSGDAKQVNTRANGSGSIYTD